MTETAKVKAGIDDLDLDGNWAVGGDDDEIVTGAATQVSNKKRKRASSANTVHHDDLVPVPMGVGKVESKPSGKKKRKKKKKLGYGEALDVAAKESATTRLVAAWAAESKASSLSALESKELLFVPSWFALDTQVMFARLPQSCDSTCRSPCIRALRDGKDPAAGVARSSCVVVLCMSTERAFTVVDELKEAWNLKRKPFALVKHGGGRLVDQVSRQGKVLAGGVAVAVATPGRLTRLIEEGLFEMNAAELLVLDTSVDRKQRSLLTLPETRCEMFVLLRKHVVAHLGKQQGVQLALCSSS